MQYSSRIKKLQTYLKENALDAFLVLTKINRQYLSGFTGSKGYLLVTRRSATLFVDDRYTTRAKKESDVLVQHIEDIPNITRNKKTRMQIGVEDEISLYQFNRLKQQIKNAQWVITRRAVDHIRAQKTAKEINAIKKGSKIIDTTFRHIRSYIKKNLKKGLTEINIAQEIERVGKKHGAQGLSFDPIVAFGSHAAAPHHASSGMRKVRGNNFLLLDFGFVVRGYHSDFTRTLFIGTPNKKQENVYTLVQEAQERAVDAIAAGMIGSEIDSIARGFIERAGHKEHFTHCTGHGVGLEIHEAPNLCPDSNEELFENTVVTVEPGVYIEGWGGVRIEDMVVVGETNGKPISSIPKDLKNMIV